MDRDRIYPLRTVDIVERGNTHKVVIQLETSLAIDLAKEGMCLSKKLAADTVQHAEDPTIPVKKT